MHKNRQRIMEDDSPSSVWSSESEREVQGCDYSYLKRVPSYSSFLHRPVFGRGVSIGELVTFWYGFVCKSYSEIQSNCRSYGSSVFGNYCKLGDCSILGHGVIFGRECVVGDYATLEGEVKGVWRYDVVRVGTGCTIERSPGVGRTSMQLKPGRSILYAGYFRIAECCYDRYTLFNTLNQGIQVFKQGKHPMPYCSWLKKVSKVADKLDCNKLNELNRHVYDLWGVED